MGNEYVLFRELYENGTSFFCGYILRSQDDTRRHLSADFPNRDNPVRTNSLDSLARKCGAPLIGYGSGDSVTTIPAIRKVFDQALGTRSTQFPIDEGNIGYFEDILIKDYRRYGDYQN